MGQSENPVWAPYYTGMNKSHKSIVTQLPLLPEGGDLRYYWLFSQPHSRYYWLSFNSKQCGKKAKTGNK